jgi:hypothetical protein
VIHTLLRCQQQNAYPLHANLTNNACGDLTKQSRDSRQRQIALVQRRMRRRVRRALLSAPYTHQQITSLSIPPSSSSSQPRPQVSSLSALYAASRHPRFMIRLLFSLLRLRKNNYLPKLQLFTAIVDCILCHRASRMSSGLCKHAVSF